MYIYNSISPNCSYNENVSTSHVDLCTIHLWWYLAESFLEWEMFQTKAVENIRTLFMFNNFFFRKSRRLWDNVKNIEEPERPQMAMAHALCVLDKWQYRLMIFDTYWFSTTVVIRTRLSVTLYLSWLVLFPALYRNYHCRISARLLH